MKKTFTILLLCVLTLAMLLCGCNQNSQKEDALSDLVKKVEIREDQDQLTVLYEDGYERVYSLTQPFDVVTDKENNTRSVRAIGANVTFQFAIVGNAQAIITGGGIALETDKFTQVDGTLHYETVVGGGNIIFSTGDLSSNGEFYAYQTQAMPLTYYFEHNGKKYENCFQELLTKFREKTTLLDFVTGYEEEPIDSISQSGFTNFENLEAIILPTSIKEVGQKAFDGCQKLTTVYFLGTEEEWGTVKLAETEIKDKDGKEPIETTPNYLTTCTVYFYSEEEPTALGNYWHYVDGTPTQWEGEVK